MQVWFTSDTHFYHKNILKYTNRPYSTIEEMNESIIADWNSKVSPDDCVYHLGDFAFSSVTKASEILARLRGRKYLVAGNHDYSFLKKEIFKQHWEWIKPYYFLKHDGESMALFHFPIAVWDHMHHGAWMLHGHSHGSYHVDGKILDVGIDNVGGLISFDKVKEYMANRSFVKLDHHHEETN